MIRVLLVDDNALMRLGLDMAVTSQADLVCCGSASDGRLGVELVRVTQPDVVVMDLTMPHLDGIAATREILRERSHVKVLVLTFRSDRASVSAAIGAGARGYVLKGTPDIGVLEGIRAVHAGRRPAVDIRGPREQEVRLVCAS